MGKLGHLKVGDSVKLCKGIDQSWDSTVLRVGKRTVSVSRKESHGVNYQQFRKSDGYDLGPLTKNVYFLKDCGGK